MHLFTKVTLAALCLSLPVVAGAQETATQDTTMTTTVGATTPIAAVETPAPRNIMETAAASGSLNTFVTAIKAAGLMETLVGKGPFTVFAPTDEAFAKLPKGTLDALLKDKAKLAAILNYHVLPGKVTSVDLASMKSAETANGKKLEISAKDGKVMIDRATVVQADIPASNGLIHSIDTVLMVK